MEPASALTDAASDEIDEWLARAPEVFSRALAHWRRAEADVSASLQVMGDVAGLFRARRADVRYGDLVAVREGYEASVKRLASAELAVLSLLRGR